MKVTLMLADSAQAVGGKLYVLGGGWSVTGPGPMASAIALKVEVPWSEANARHTLALELLDQDGAQVTPGGSDGPLRFEGNFEVGRPPGLPHGTPLDFVFALGVPPLQLTPGARYTWRLLIDGEGHPDWHVAFQVRESPSP